MRKKFLGMDMPSGSKEWLGLPLLGVALANTAVTGLLTDWATQALFSNVLTLVAFATTLPRWKAGIRKSFVYGVYVVIFLLSAWFMLMDYQTSPLLRTVFKVNPLVWLGPMVAAMLAAFSWYLKTKLDPEVSATKS